LPRGLTPSGASRRRSRARLFRWSVLLKGADAVLEVAGGIVLLVSPDLLRHLAARPAQAELAEDPRDFLANRLLAAAWHFSVGTEHFWAAYLLGHGVVKLLLVAALLRGRL
jgi:uncharacterized membrane protein